MGYRVRHVQIGIWLASGGYLLCGLRLAVAGAPATFITTFAVLGVLGLTLLRLPWRALLEHRLARRVPPLTVAANLAAVAVCVDLDRTLLPLYPAAGALALIYLGLGSVPGAVAAVGCLGMVGYSALAIDDGMVDVTMTVSGCAVLVASTALGMWISGRRAMADSGGGRRRDRRIETLLEHASDAVLATDERGAVWYQSPSATTLLGYKVGELVGSALDGLVHPGDAEAARRWYEALVSASGGTSRIEIRIRRADGSWGHTEVTGVNRIGDRTLDAVVLNIRDIGTRKDLENQLAIQSLSDSLTGLANRALFRDRVIHAVERGRRSAATIALLVVDLDGFKLTNDALGQASGDEILTTVAERLRSCIRPSDTLARLGADEFALLVEERIDEISAVALGDRLLEVVRPPIHLGSRDLSITASIGIAVVKAGVYGAADADELLRDADLAMYAAKSTGRNRSVLFDPAMHIEVLRGAQQRVDLETALAEDQFVVQYQPIVDLPTLKLVGVEALVRWQHPTQGLTGPSEFIPLAESTGLIVPLGRWVLQRACAQAVAWQRAWPIASGLRVSVNLSARQFQYSGLVEDVAKVLRTTGITPSSVVLEITESLLMLDTEATVATLNELKALGVRLAIDDFGTGYSSLSYLRRFPVDIIKIDRSFIDGITTESENSTLTEAVVSLGRSLRLQTVAEGIETPEQSARLRALGCDYGQGFLFARPVRAEDIEPMLIGT
ncbi:MAG: EAL domain-containing protein [Dactylosporangium sp.]|nr:EAL domain-containing protein [Dactylosporangium sp.]NNJ59778.1 EAL domain-containing protein [Dactylosporangium sp.]